MPTVISDTNYEQYLKENKNTLLYFTASWCGPCKSMKPHFEKAEKDLQILDPSSDLKFVMVDVDDAPNASTFFKIECMPTLVLIKDQVVVDRTMGAMDDKKLLLLIDKHFNITKSKQNSVYTETHRYSN